MAIAIVHAILGVVFSINTPLWESYDETGHYAYARYIALNNNLPAKGQSLSRWDESHQPPLYYWLASLPIRLIDVSDDAQPRFTVPGAIYVVPDPELDAFPYRGTALAMRSARMVSVVLGTLAVVLTYLGTLALIPGRRDIALLATAFHGMWPLLLFLGGVVTNDVAIAFFASLVLFLGARVLNRAPDASRAGPYGALAVGVAGAVSAKDSGLSLVVFAVIVILVDVARQMRAMTRLRAVARAAWFVVPLVALFVLAAVVTDGRTARQFLSAGSFANAISDTLMQPTGDAWRGLGSFIPIWFDWLWRLTFNTLFGSFGWGLVRLPRDWYDLALGAAVVCGLATLRAAFTSTRRGPIAFLVLFIVCIAAAPVVRTVATGNLSLMMGRFFLPMVGAICAAFAVGLTALPRTVGRFVALTTLAGMSMVALLTPFLVLQTIYRRPPLLDPNIAPEGMSHVAGIRYGDAIELLGYTAPAKTWRGEYTDVTLFWRALSDIEKDFGLRVEMFAIDGTSFENGVAVTPGREVYPTGIWHLGDTFSETYYLKVPLTGPAPTVATFKANWFDMDGSSVIGTLPAVCAPEQPCDPKFGTIAVGISPSDNSAWRAFAPVFKASLGSAEAEALNTNAPGEIRAGEPLTISLVWRLKRGSFPAVNAFVHLVDLSGSVVAQGDGPPRNGQYPAPVWSANEYIPDTYRIASTGLPAGQYVVRFGLYDPLSGQRATLTDSRGNPVRDDAIDFATLTIR